MSPLSLKRPGRPEPISETAAGWLLKVEEGAMSAADESRFREWLAVPEHARAYEDVLWGLDALQRHATAPELMAMRSAALAQRTEPRRVAWAVGLTSLAASAIGLFLWIGVVQGPETAPREPAAGPVSAGHENAADGIYRTGVGERSAVVLPDGSVATLDTASQLRVAYSATERGVHLVRGQALFEVAKNQPQPFSVYAGGQRITAVGTTFNVRIQRGHVSVSMIEGVVKVQALPASARRGVPVRELTLREGESLVAAPAQLASIKAVDISQVAAWRGGLLVFEDEKMSDAIAEINRYTDRPIRLADPSLGEYRVTGVFKTNDPAHFAVAMSEVFPVRVERDSAGSLLIRSAR